MFSFRHPDDAALRAFLAAQQRLSLTYAQVTASQSLATLPAGYPVDDTRVLLGHGVATFSYARQCLRHWQQYNLNWVRAFPVASDVQRGADVCVVARVATLYSVNAVRVVYVQDAPDVFAYAVGTLPAHNVSGEERFEVRIDTKERVYYRILAFSKPANLLVRVGRPVARYYQRRFSRASLTHMRRLCATSG